MVKLICFLLLVSLFIPAINGQELYGKFLDQEQGLLSNECYDINYDEKGYLIVSTQYGPMKYDGEKFISICTNLPMGRRVIYDFERSPDGKVYLLNSKNELFKLENDKAIWIGPRNRHEFVSPDFNFQKLYFTSNGIYISTFSKFLKYSFKTKKASHYYQFPHNRFIYHSKKPFPFLKKRNSKRLNSYVKFECPESNQQFDIEGVVDSREDAVRVGKTTYILMGMQLFKKVNNRVTQLKFNRVLFLEYFHNRIWLCTLDGLMELDHEGNLIHHHFKGEVIGGVSPLKSRGIAISLNQKGVFISPNIDNRIYYNFTPMSATKINGINLLGSLNGDLFEYKDYKLEPLARIKSIVEINSRRSYLRGIQDISVYKNSLVLRSGYGLSFFTADFKPARDFRNNQYAMFGHFTDQDNIYYIQRACLIKVNWKNITTLPFPYKELVFQIKDLRCHVRFNDSIIILGTSNELLKYHLKTDRISRFDLFKKELRITGLHSLGKNRLLISTRFDGVYISCNNKIIRKIKAPCVSISSFLLYKDQLIIRGNDGIYITRLNQTKKFVWLKLFNGESENMFILDQKLLIAYKKDMIIQNLSDYKTTHKPQIVLNRFQLGHTKMDSFPQFIPPNKSISIDIDILQFDANKLDLYYNLKGRNNVSQQVEGTKINFNALKSGKYELKIHPVIDGEIQFNSSKSFRFTIGETFWESTVFYIITGVLVVSIIFSIFLVINLRRKRRSQERAELESRLNEYKLLAVKAQVNPHFLSNGLAAIQALILKGDNDNAAHYLAKFSFLMRKILYYSETQFISAKQELELVDAYLELELLRFRNRFKIQKEIQLSENQLNEFNFPSLLLQPILENAIWHGLKFQEHNPELLILIVKNEQEELVVQISDNGPGFNASNKSEEHLSKGNQLISERIDALNKQFHKQVASMQITTSFSGTKVIFKFAPELYQSKQI